MGLLNLPVALVAASLFSALAAAFVVHTHDQALWTEGLACRWLPSGEASFEVVESSGMPSRSSLTRYQLRGFDLFEAGRTPLENPPEVFAEGVTFIGSQVLVATQTHGFAFSFISSLSGYRKPSRLPIAGFARQGTDEALFKGLAELLGSHGEAAGESQAKLAQDFFDLDEDKSDREKDSLTSSPQYRTQPVAEPLVRAWGLATIPSSKSTGSSPIVVLSDGSNSLRFFSSDLSKQLGRHKVQFPPHVPKRPLKGSPCHAEDEVWAAPSEIALNELEFVSLDSLSRAARRVRGAASAASSDSARLSAQANHEKEAEECVVPEYHSTITPTKEQGFVGPLDVCASRERGEIWATIVGCPAAVLRIEPCTGNAIGWLNFGEGSDKLQTGREGERAILLETSSGELLLANSDDSRRRIRTKQHRGSAKRSMTNDRGGSSSAQSLSGELATNARRYGDLNGIALCDGGHLNDASTGPLLVLTGKNWPSIVVAGLDEIMTTATTAAGTDDEGFSACEIDYYQEQQR
jgi:Glutamine cyclotransferase